MKHFPPPFIVVLFFACATHASPHAPWFPKAPPLPKPTGQVINVTNVKELIQATKDVKVGGSILLADGVYRMPAYLEITTDNVTLRSASGQRDKVVIDGAGSRHGELIGITGCEGVVIADMTVQNVKWNGIKINSDRGAQRVTIHNCVIHNIWQRGVKAPAVPKEKQDALSPRDCRVQYCLFYNDRPKQFSDDETENPDRFNGNYIGGIDAKNTVNWKITHNVFVGIQGRTREGRGAIYISENGRGCVIKNNIFIDCDIAIALGNPTLGYSPLQAIDCIARNNFISGCPESGILTCYTQRCVIKYNTVHDPETKRGRLIWVQKTNEGLRLENNLLVGGPVLITGSSKIAQAENMTTKSRSLQDATAAATPATAETRVGQTLIDSKAVADAASFWTEYQAKRSASAKLLLKPGLQSDACIAAMRKVHAGFKGQEGYVAQFGDSITFSMAFWSPMSWSAPDQYLTTDDDLPKTPEHRRWRDVIKGARDKGSKHANYSGWTVGQLLGAIDGALERNKPEVAIIMIGTNDISGGRVPANYRKGLESVVQKCIDAHCVPILNTIPPRRDRDAAVAAVNVIIRDIAKKQNVPLVDFHAECVRLRPKQSWQNTIMANDGVHPSGGESHIYTEDNFMSRGYALRNWVNFLAYRQLYFRVLHAK